MKGSTINSSTKALDEEIIKNTQKNENNRKPEIIQQAIPVPYYKIGWIVGRRGSYINQLCRKSGATISVSDSESKEFGTTWKYVMMHGTGREIDRAKKLLHIRLERYIPRSDEELAASKNILLNGSNIDDEEHEVGNLLDEK